VTVTSATCYDDSRSIVMVAVNKLLIKSKLGGVRHFIGLNLDS